jgi:hypothetical protein
MNRRKEGNARRRIRVLFLSSKYDLAFKILI